MNLKQTVTEEDFPRSVQMLSDHNLLIMTNSGWEHLAYISLKCPTYRVYSPRCGTICSSLNRVFIFNQHVLELLCKTWTIWPFYKIIKHIEATGHSLGCSHCKVTQILLDNIIDKFAMSPMNFICNFNYLSVIELAYVCSCFAPRRLAL